MKMRKRLTALLLATAVLLPVVSIQAEQQEISEAFEIVDVVDGNGSIVGVESVVVTPDCATVEATVYIKNANIVSIGSFNFNVEFDSTKLEVKDIRAGDEFSRFAMFDLLLEEGKVAVGSLSAAPEFVNDAELAVITFTVLDNSEAVIQLGVSNVDIFYEDVVLNAGSVRSENAKLDISQMFDGFKAIESHSTNLYANDLGFGASLADLNVDIASNSINSTSVEPLAFPAAVHSPGTTAVPTYIVRSRQVVLYTPSHIPNTTTQINPHIRFTLDDSAVTETSPVYQAPITTVAQTIHDPNNRNIIRARVYVFNISSMRNVPIGEERRFVYDAQNVKGGHLRNDTRISSGDATLALRLALGTDPGTPITKAAADIDGTGVITTDIATLLLRHAMMVTLGFYVPTLTQAGDISVTGGATALSVFLPHIHDGSHSITMVLPTGIEIVNSNNNISMFNNFGTLRLRNTGASPGTYQLQMSLPWHLGSGQATSYPFMLKV